MATVARQDPPSPVVSSSSTLWATASKEWVIPAKPKPGRKPKRDAVTVAEVDDETSDSKGRRIQNRAAQRAFRERKQSQLAEMQARIQMYEQGEIERNVALQSVAKRLKEENDALRKENILLKEKVAQYERERDPQRDAENKRWREELPLEEYTDHPSRKRTKLAINTIDAMHTNVLRLSPPSSASSPGSNETSENSHSPMITQSPSRGTTIFTSTQISPLDGMFEYQVGTKDVAIAYDNSNTIAAFDCGFCSHDTPCVCLAMTLQHGSNNLDMPASTTFKAESLEQSTVTAAHAPQSASILDNLPAYQPPVPLRRRPANPGMKSIFPVFPSPASTSSTASTAALANCSGDPSNCMACADDDFGKAFCEAIGDAVAAQPRCEDCPSSRLDGTRMCADAESGRGCCGIPGFCSGKPPRNPSIRPPSDTTLSNNSARGPDIIPTSDAWRQLKSHPNVAFADLSLLADVVARRSKCTGPTVVISPAPGSITPERTSSPDSRAITQIVGISSGGGGGGDGQDAVLLSDPHAHYRMKQEERSIGSSPPPNLVAEEELMKCSRSRPLREVHADGVREALRLLDSRFGRA
ncbi:hypothetical protein BV25DRAFT_1818792 [Artomyces pyxidatus]|uniref:Uncharacterized protein n=1 Tax=Artomyces pyxidatus TaxID=48021 RepID=A0ACB8TIW6_9AGAM|nr:hypothetical protein BV25DRAFT_1818792 [Artomyces pyxidatus]